MTNPNNDPLALPAPDPLAGITVEKLDQLIREVRHQNVAPRWDPPSFWQVPNAKTYSELSKAIPTQFVRIVDLDGAPPGILDPLTIKPEATVDQDPER